MFSHTFGQGIAVLSQTTLNDKMISERDELFTLDHSGAKLLRKIMSPGIAKPNNFLIESKICIYLRVKFFLYRKHQFVPISGRSLRDTKRQAV